MCARDRQCSTVLLQPIQSRLAILRVNVNDGEAGGTTSRYADQRIWPSRPPAADLLRVCCGGEIAIRGEGRLVLPPARENRKAASGPDQGGIHWSAPFSRLTASASDRTK